MLRRRLPCLLVRTRQGGGLLEPAGQGVDIERVDEHSGRGRHELRRAADARRHDGAAAGHRLEQRLAERLDEARLREHATLREETRNLVVRDAPEQTDPIASLEPGAKRPVAGEREGSLAESREGLGQPDDVLPLVELRLADLDQPRD